jgi:hypothetical protein
MAVALICIILLLRQSLAIASGCIMHGFGKMAAKITAKRDDGKVPEGE